MRNFKLIIAIVLLVCSVILLSMRLFTPQTIQITLESGREVTTENPDYYTLTDVLIIVTGAFLMGASAIYLYYNSDVKDGFMQRWDRKARHGVVLGMLKGEDRKAYSLLISSGGEMLQSRLVDKMGISKVKVTRILARLEQKGLIVRHRSGLTNKITLVKREDDAK